MQVTDLRLKLSAYVPFIPPPQPPQLVENINELSKFTRKIVAVGDLHGDLKNALKVLKMSDVVDEKGDWSGKIDVFAQTGDIIDR